MTNISMVNSFVEQCAQKHPSGIAVGEFAQELHSMFGSRMLSVIATPVAGATVSVFDKLEEAKKQGRLVPSFNAVKIVQHVQKQLAKQDTLALEPRLEQLASKEDLQPILTKKNMVWVKGLENTSLQEMIDESKTGSGLYGLSEEMLDAVQKTLAVKRYVHLLFPCNSQNVFDNLSLDASKDLVEQFFEQIPIARGPAPRPEEEIDTLDFDLSEGFDDDLLASMQKSTSVSPSTVDEFSDVEILELDDITMPSFEDEMQKAFSTIHQSHGEWIAGKAKEMVSLDAKARQVPVLVSSKMSEIADQIRFILEDFSEEYDEELVNHVMKYIQFTSQEDLYAQLCAKADSTIIEHEKKIEYLNDLFDEDAEFGIDPRAKEYVFYTKTLWPGYESEGEFSLAVAGSEEGRYLDLDFVLTDAVENKMHELADEHKALSELRKQLLDISKEVGADLTIALSTYETLRNKRQELGEPASLPLDDTELAWAKEHMSFFVTQQQQVQ